MSDETRSQRDSRPPRDEQAPSAIFVELMRQAAARQSAQPPSPEPTEADPVPPPAAVDDTPEPPLSEEVPPEDSSGDYTDEELADLSLATRTRLQEQRLRRMERRRKRNRQQAVGLLGAGVRTFIISVVASMLLGTILTWFTDADFLNPDVRDDLGGLQVVAATQAVATQDATAIPTPNWARRIGIVSGHRGRNPFTNLDDPGAVCPDGLTEAEINFNTATTVVRLLRERGYTVDLLDEFDQRLNGYQAAALVSIHANTCQDFGELVSGYIIASAAARASLGGPDPMLVECIASYYGPATGLERRFQLTIDMTDYHTFREIHALTPAVIIELGFMLADREVLTNRTAEMAQAIVDGVECFLRGDTPGGTPTVDPALLTLTPADSGIIPPTP